MMFSDCCSRRKTLIHGSSVYGPLRESLKDSLNKVQTTVSNGMIWSVKLSDKVENSNVWASSREEAIRLAQWYAYLDYKDLSS